MKTCYVIKVKRTLLRSNEWIGDERRIKEHETLRKRDPRDTDQIGGIYLKSETAYQECEYCNKILSEKEWIKENPEGIKNEYFVEFRDFYVEPQMLIER